MKRWIDKLLRLLGVANIPRVRKIFVGVVGLTILLIGVVMILLPGPAFIVIPLGLAVLSTEFVWAKRWLEKVREMFDKTKRRLARQPK